MAFIFYKNMIRETRITTFIEEIETHPKISTLEFTDKQKGRAVGNTTRQIDFAIQKLFEGYRVKIEDHYCREHHWLADKALFKKVIARLELEHGITENILNKTFDIDFSKLELEFLV